ncbi:hypothetical protein [Sedimenticola sp.]|uniref:hypothetical protein n=1 Tax=Sedimenticola sp. TaxID=1940285 RepID=UPI003D0D46D4
MDLQATLDHCLEYISILVKNYETARKSVIGVLIFYAGYFPVVAPPEGKAADQSGPVNCSINLVKLMG